MINIIITNSKNMKAAYSAFITFDYDDKIIKLIRDEPERYFDKEKNEWEIPSTRLLKIISKLNNNSFHIEGEYDSKIGETNYPDDFEFKTAPFQHQIDGLFFGLDNDIFILADEQGLGKTKQVIDIAVAKKITKGYKHCLIICGVNGLKWNWQMEVEKHSNETAYILGTRIRKQSGNIYIGNSEERLNDLNNLPPDYFIITNIQTLRYSKKVPVSSGRKKIKWVFPIAEKIEELCLNGTFGLAAIDEIHKCKNSESQQGKAIMSIQTESRIAMTGTPIMNNPLDIYSSLHWLGLEDHNLYQFKKHFCIYDSFGSGVVGYKNLSQIRELLDKYMLRRLKKDVLDLPDKIHSIEYVEMLPKQKKIYNEVLSAIKDDIDLIRMHPDPLSQLIRLRQATGYTGILSSTIMLSAKLDRMEELVEEYVENGEKVIIFSNWTKITDPAIERLKKYNSATITGKTKNRQEEEKRFMTDQDCKVIIGTIAAMGTGLTLTAGTNVIFLDEPWNRALKDQSEDRAHRIGTTGTVNIITLVTKDSIDERIYELVQSKGEMADLIVDGKVKKGHTGNLLDYLIS